MATTVSGNGVREGKEKRAKPEGGHTKRADRGKGKDSDVVIDMPERAKGGENWKDKPLNTRDTAVDMRGKGRAPKEEKEMASTRDSEHEPKTERRKPLGDGDLGEKKKPGEAGEQSGRTQKESATTESDEETKRLRRGTRDSPLDDPLTTRDTAVILSGKGREDEEEDLYHTYKDLWTEMWEIGDPFKIIKYEWRKPIAELLGTAMLTFFGTGVAIAVLSRGGMTAPAIIAIGLAFGFAGATAIYATAEISGGHINPAVSIGMFAAMKMPLITCLLYIGAQITGGILGSALVKGCIPNELASNVNYASTSLAQNFPWNTGKGSGTSSINIGQGVLIEIVLTYTLVFTAFATAKLPREKSNMGRMAPLAIGLAILIAHLFGALFTGPSINPARSFGPAVISGYWDNHWVYWVGPIVGGILAGLTYKYLFIVPTRLTTITKSLRRKGKHV